MQLHFSSEKQQLTLSFCRHSHRCLQRIRRQHTALEIGKNKKLLRNTKPPPEQPLLGITILMAFTWNPWQEKKQPAENCLNVAETNQ